MPLIEIDHLTKTLSGHTLLDDVCIGIEDGAFVVLLGANGAGKTTLIKCLTGLYRADHGSIRVAGMEWNKANDHKIKRLFSYVPDKANFDHNLNVEQNLIHHAALYGIKADQARADIDRLFEFFGLAGRQTDFIGQYSFGMGKKALIVRGLLSKPRILIFDEPTIGLDYRAKVDLIEELLRLNSTGITVLLSTQSLQVAYKAHKVIYIERGRAREVDPAVLAAQAGQESLRFSTAAISGRQADGLRTALLGLPGVRDVQTDAYGLQVVVDKDPELIAGCIREVLCAGISPFEIEFESVSYSHLYLQETAG